MYGDGIIAAALIRRADEILLIRRHREPGPVEWRLPSAVSEAGELVIDTLVRGVREESGLEVLRVGRLLAVTQIADPSGQPASAEPGSDPTSPTTMFVFEVTRWRGELHAGGAAEPQFLPRDQVVARLQEQAPAVIAEPVVTHLRTREAGAVWLYRREPEGGDTLVWPAGEEDLELDDRMRRARSLFILGCLILILALLAIVIVGIITLARPYV